MPVKCCFFFYIEDTVCNLHHECHWSTLTVFSLRHRCSVISSDDCDTTRVVTLWLSIKQLGNHTKLKIFCFTKLYDQSWFREKVIILNRFCIIFKVILIRDNVTDYTEVIWIHRDLLHAFMLAFQREKMYLHFTCHQQYKTDLGTGPLYYGLRRRVNGERRWSLEYLPDFIFWNVGTQRTTHQELYKVYFNGMFMIYLFIFWRKNRNISIKCHNWTYFYYWDLKCMNVNATQCEQISIAAWMNNWLTVMRCFSRDVKTASNHWNELQINEKVTSATCPFV